LKKWIINSIGALRKVEAIKRKSKREEKDEDRKYETIIFLCTNTCK
jgi:hypothetical protein